MKKLSAYRIMWLQVIFDLPVKTPLERKQATDFRNCLLDLGFEMEQFSVYFRFCSDKSHAESIGRGVEAQLPPNGSVKMLTFTDKQYENIRSFQGAKKGPERKNPAQLVLF